MTATAGPDPGPVTVLLVEDDEKVRALTELFLRQLGFTVASASTPDTARLLCEAYSHSLRLIVVDAVMPEMPGVQLAAVLLAIAPSARLLVMSGHDARSLQEQGLLADTTPFLQKPFNRQELARGRRFARRGLMRRAISARPRVPARAARRGPASRS